MSESSLLDMYSLAFHSLLLDFYTPIINDKDNRSLTEFNDDFIRRIIEQVTVLSASQIRIRFVGGYELDTTMPLQK